LTAKACPEQSKERKERKVFQKKNPNPSCPPSLLRKFGWGGGILPSELRKHYELVVPAWNAGTQVHMDVSGRILRAWMPAIHAGMTEAADGQKLRAQAHNTVRGDSGLSSEYRNAQ